MTSAQAVPVTVQLRDAMPRALMNLVGKCRMLACRPDPQKDRHEMSGPTCRRHVR